MRILYNVLFSVALGINLCLATFFFSVLIGETPVSRLYGFLDEQAGYTRSSNAEFCTFERASRDLTVIVPQNDFTGGVNCNYAVESIDGLKVACFKISQDFVDSAIKKLKKGQRLAYPIELTDGSTGKVYFTRNELKKLRAKFSESRWRIMVAKPYNQGIFQDDATMVLGLEPGGVKRLMRELSSEDSPDDADLLRIEDPESRTFGVISREELTQINRQIKKQKANFAIITKSNYQRMPFLDGEVIGAAMQVTHLNAAASLVGLTYTALVTLIAILRRILMPQHY